VQTPTAPTQPLILPTSEGYDLWAAIYDTDGNPLTALEEPHVDAALGDVSGLRVIDVGCGTGRHAIRLASRGAEVVAMDFSRGMLEKARAKPGAERIRFIQHDLAAPFPVPDGAFDRVVCALVLEHVADLAPVFRELSRVCAPGGRIVISEMHPAMMLLGVSARFHDPTTGREIRPRSVGHPVGEIVMAALGAGLSIESIGEYRVDEELTRRAPRAAKYLGWPLLLMITATQRARA